MALHHVDIRASPEVGLPSNLETAIKSETEAHVRVTLEFLSNHDRLVEDHGRFMYMLRLVTLVDQRHISLYVSFEDRKEIIRNLTELMRHPGLSWSQFLRVADAATTVIGTILDAHSTPVWMVCGARLPQVGPERLAEVARMLDWAWLESLVFQHYDRGLRTDCTTGPSRRKSYVTVLAKLVAQCAALWRYDEEITEAIVAHWSERLDSMDMKQHRVFLNVRLMNLMVPSPGFVSMFQSGKLIEWWGRVEGASVASWDPLWTGCLCRAVKEGWATGQPLNELLRPFLPTFAQIVYLHLGLPSGSLGRIGGHREPVPGEYTPLADKSGMKKLARTWVLLLEPEESVGGGGKGKEKGEMSSSGFWTALKSLLEVCFPYTHPSSSGKWSGVIGSFVGSLVSCYVKRVARERMGSAIVKPSVGRVVVEGEVKTCNRLGRRDDEKLAELLLPMLLQGIFGKATSAAVSFEDALKRICYLLPDQVLPTVFSRLLSSLDNVTETHRTMVSIRLATHLSPLIVKHIPSVITPLTQALLPGIQPVDPLKSVLCLTFFTVLFAHVPARDFSDADTDCLPLEAVRKALLAMEYPEHDGAAGGASSSSLGFLQEGAGKEAGYEWVKILEDWGVRPVGLFPSIYNYPRGKEKGGGQTVGLGGAQRLSAEEEAMAQLTEVLPVDLRTVGESNLMGVVRQRQNASSMMPEWSLSFFEALQSVVQSSLKPEKSATINMQVDITQGLMIRAALLGVLQHADEGTCLRLLDSHTEWLCAHTLPEALKQTGALTRAFSTAIPKATTKRLIPLAAGRLLKGGEKQKGKGQDGDAQTPPHTPEMKEHLPETDVQWWMLTLCQSVRRAGEEILRFKDVLESVIVAALRHEQKRIFRLGAKLLRRCLEGLLFTYALDVRCAPSTIWNSDRRRPLQLLCWGSTTLSGDSKGDSVAWHVPTEEGLQWAERLVDLAYTQTFALLGALLPGPSVERRDFEENRFSLPDPPDFSPLYESTGSSTAAAAGAAGGEACEGGEGNHRSGGQRGKGKMSLCAVRDESCMEFFDLQKEKEDSQSHSGVPKQGGEGEENGLRGFDSLSDAVKKQAAFFKLSRALLLMRTVVKGTAGCFPDERSEGDDEFVFLSALPNRLGPLLLKRSGTLVLRIAHACLGLQPAVAVWASPPPSSGDGQAAAPPRGPGDLGGGAGGRSDTDGQVAVVRVAPRLSFFGVEEPKLMKKLLRVVYALLVRPFCGSSSKGGKALSSFSQISFQGGLFKHSLSMDTPRIWWLDSLNAKFSERVDLRRRGHPFKGMRRLLLTLVASMCIGSYAQVRRLAQDVFRDACGHHYGARRKLAFYFLSELVNNSRGGGSPAAQIVPRGSLAKEENETQATVEFGDGKDGMPKLTVATASLRAPMSPRPLPLQNPEAASQKIGDPSERSHLSSRVPSLNVDAPPAVPVASSPVPSPIASPMPADGTNDTTEKKLQQKFSPPPNGGPGRGGSVTAATAATAAAASDVQQQQQQQQGDDAEDLARLSAITGVCFCLNSTTMLRRVWGDAKNLGRTICALVAAFRAPISRDSVQGRVMALVHQWLAHRVFIPREEDWDTHVVKGAVLPILQTLHEGAAGAAAHTTTTEVEGREGEGGEGGGADVASAPVQRGAGGPSHWRYQLLCTVALVALNSPSAPNASVVESYGLWLLKGVDTSKFTPLLNTVCLHGLMQFLKQNAKTLDKLPTSFTDKLRNPESVKKVLKGLVVAHHESLRSSPQRYPETALNPVVEVVRLEITWPFYRSSRLSTGFSIHNALFTQTFFRALARLVPENEMVSLLEGAVRDTLDSLAELPSEEADSHVALLEIFAGAVRASRKWVSDSLRSSLWGVLDPVLKKEIGKAPLERLGCWSDALRFCVYDLKYSGDLDRLKPVLNFGLDWKKHLDAPTLHLLVSLDASKTSTTTLELVKQLRLYQSLLIELFYSSEALLEAAMAVIRESFGNPYKQIREELGRCFYFFICLCQDRQCPPAVKKKFSAPFLEYAREEAKRIQPLVEEDTTSAAERLEGAARPDFICLAENLAYGLIHTLLGFEGRDPEVQKTVVEMLPLMFAGAKHPDTDLSGLSLNALAFAFSPHLIKTLPYGETAAEMAVSLSKEESRVAEGGIELLGEGASHRHWKVREISVRLSESLGASCRLCLFGSGDTTRLLDICRKTLADENAQVRLQCQNAITALVLGCEEGVVRKFTKEFQEMAGPLPPPPGTKADRVMSGVQGLAALVGACPYHVPPWMPDTVTALARYGHARSADQVKKLVQKSLQEFFRTHQDAWKQQHQRHFSEEQLDILDAYKGRPAYFT